MRKLPISLLVLMIVLLSSTPVFAHSVKGDNPSFRNIKIAEPQIQFVINGEAQVWEGTFHYRVKSGNQVLLHGSKKVTKGAPAWSKFLLEFSFLKNKVKGKKLTLELYQKSAKNGSIINKLTIPLNKNEKKKYYNKIFRNVTQKANYIYHIKGEARVWGAIYQYSVSDGHDYLVKGSGTTSKGAPKWGTFAKTIKIPKSKTPVNGTILLELYQEDMSGNNKHINPSFHRLDQFPW